MATRKSFGSDNHSPAHPRVLAALAAANDGHSPAYGDDPWTAQAVADLRQRFGAQAEVFLVFNGTGSNVLALRALCRPWEAVICPASAHINTDETGAPEHNTGLKLLTVACPDGKLTPGLVQPLLTNFGNPHHVQPRLLSLSQTTELGTVYTPAEIRALADLAHAHGLLLHVDGARLANAAAALEVSLADLTSQVGVDVVGFGGTKNGLLFGEALIFLRPELATGVTYLRKQSLQLASKMRYLGAQLSAVLEDELYLQTAGQANRMARLLADGLTNLPEVRLAQPVQANALFVHLPVTVGRRLQAEYTFYWWDEAAGLARWMTSWDTTEADVADFLAALRRLLKINLSA